MTTSSRLPETSDNCPLCEGTKFMFEPGTMKVVPCRCQAPKVWQPAPAYQAMTFATFKDRKGLPAEERRSLNAAVQEALRFVHGDKTILTLMGPNGVGKTHLALAIAQEAAASGVEPLFWSVSTLLDQIRRTYNDDKAPDVFSPCLTVPLLVLDDLGSQKSSDWVDEKLFMIIDGRYMAGLKTVITTNLDPAKQLPARISSRLRDAVRCQIVVMVARDVRPALDKLGA